MTAPALVELCAGSAAVSRFVTGGWRLVGYAGNKDGYAPPIVDALRIGTPGELVLADPGLWHAFWVAAAAGRLDDVADVVADWCARDARALYHELRNNEESCGVRSAARSICLLAGTHGGHERGGFKGKHKHRPNVDGFIPSRNSIVTRLRAVPPLPPLRVYRDARDVPPIRHAVCYIDPPYVGTHRYANHLSRSEVVALAAKWSAHGATVGVSEQEPVIPSWARLDMTRTRKGQARVNTKSRVEWLTYKPALR